MLLPLACLFLLPPALGQHELGSDDQLEAYQPQVAEASEEGAQAMARFEVMEGFEVELVAAEPHLANPVCFAFDERGRLYVAETFRHHAGVTDMRQHMGWLHEDLASRTVEERLAMMRRHEGERYADYAKEHDRVRRLVDTDGDGSFDSSTVFADGFSHPAAGIGAGLLVRGGEVWFACIPDMWRLRDDDDDGQAEQREVLHTGYGVNISLLGHDLHGLTLGPDGRLYFSVGDRGLHVESEGRTIAHPHTGAVLRCELDGSGLELFATGLRNPQELVFDERGDLFTGDNNSDGGDRARWVWVLPGSDSGWRYSYQYITQPNARGPWNAEEMWKPFFRDNAQKDELRREQPAFILPPIKNVTSGPSGLTIYPGTGWGDGWTGTFFLCDFRGDPSISGVHAFRNEPRGAGFRLIDERRFLWSSLVTDVDFGPDGGLYVTDWVQGWNKTGKGRVYRVAPASEQAGEPDRPRVAASAVAQLLARGFGEFTNGELGEFLAHADRRVRLEAQLTLAQRGASSVGVLRHAARAGKSEVERLHGLWGLAHIARLAGALEPESRAAGDYPLAPLSELLDHRNPELRAQSARVVGELRRGEHRERLIAMLGSDAPRVRLFAAEALGRLEDTRAVGPLVALLAENDGRDPWLRATGIAALGRIDDRAALGAHLGHPSAAVRRALVCVLRRWRDERVALFLDDDDELVAREAIRAIYDEPLREQYSRLTHTDRLRHLDEMAWRRVINACRHVGGDRCASQLARAAVRGDLPKRVRREALEILSEWNDPHPLDRVTGAWAPIEPRSADVLSTLAGSIWNELDARDDRLREAWVGLARRVCESRPSASTPLVAVLTDLVRSDPSSRAARAALRVVVDAELEGGAELLRASLVAEDAQMRTTAFSLVDRLGDDEACGLLEEVIASGEVGVLRGALEALGRLPQGRADDLLERELGRLRAASFPSGAALELVEAAERRKADAVARALAAWRAGLDAQDPLAGWRICLSGGDAERGRKVFRDKAETTCMRCHRVGEDGGEAVGGEAGPDLSDVGGRLNGDGLLRAILVPNAEIAEGFENWIVGIEGDAPVAGRIVAEDDGSLTVATKDEGQLVIAKEDISARRRDLSGMPEDVSEHLSRRELRDLIAYLSSLRSGTAQQAGSDARK